MNLPIKMEKVIEHYEEIDYTLFYLQPEKVHVPDEKVEELITIAVNREYTPAEWLPRRIKKHEECGYESESEPREEWPKVARSIYCCNWNQGKEKNSRIIHDHWKKCI